MSRLIKKSLFFMVLSIVYNSAFSGVKYSTDRTPYADNPESSSRNERRDADNPESSSRNERRDARTAAEIAECIENVRLVFYEELDPFLAMDLSLHWLSQKVINSMTNTVELSNTLLQQFERFKKNFGEEYYRTFTVIGNKIGNQNIQITESARTDIYGYFKRLIINFETIYENLQKITYSPGKFCRIPYMFVEWVCRRAIRTLLQISDDELYGNGIDVAYAFKHCYFNYSFLDFFDNSYFSQSGSGRITYTNDQLQRVRRFYSKTGNRSLTDQDDQQTIQELQIKIAKNYYIILMGEVKQIVKEKIQNNPELLPTVEEYCNGPRSN